MGRELLAEEPVFRAAIAECDALLRPLSGWSLLDELASAGGPVSAGPDRVRPAGAVRDPGGACRAVAVLGRAAGRLWSVTAWARSRHSMWRAC